MKMSPINLLIFLFIIYIIGSFSFMISMIVRIEKLERFKKEVDEAVEEFRDSDPFPD